MIGRLPTIVPKDRVGKWRRLPLFTSLALASYVLSLFLPVEKSVPRSSGAAVFLFCLTEPMYPIFTWPALLPNVLLWIGLLLLFNRHWLGAFTCALAAAAGAVLVAVLYVNDGMSPSDVRELASGYYLWLGSMLALALSSLLRCR